MAYVYEEGHRRRWIPRGRQREIDAALHPLSYSAQKQTAVSFRQRADTHADYLR